MLSQEKIKARRKIYEYFQQVAIKENAENSKMDFEDLLDKEKKDRILVVMPESAGDVFIVTSLLPSMKESYPDKDIYFATKKPFQEILEGNPYIYKILEYTPQMDRLPLMEGIGKHKGYFELCFLPFAGTQRFLTYMHNGCQDKIQFQLKS